MLVPVGVSSVTIIRDSPSTSPVVRRLSNLGRVTQSSNIVNMDRRPRGAEQVRSALLSAASKHFAADGPNASLRDIAADAQVNVGLIHHYFGNKADLLGAVMTDIVERAQRGAQTFTSLDQATEYLLDSIPEGDPTDPGSSDYIRIVAWLLLTGQNPRDYQREFSLPAVAELADGEGRGLLLLLLTATFGWGIFGAHLSSLVGYQSQASAARDFIKALRVISAEDYSEGATAATAATPAKAPDAPTE